MDYSEVANKILVEILSKCDGRVVLSESGKYHLSNRLSYFSEDEDGLTLRTRFSPDSTNRGDYYEKSYKYADPQFPNNIISDIKFIFDEENPNSDLNISDIGYAKTSMSVLLTDEIKNEVAKTMGDPINLAENKLKYVIDEIARQNNQDFRSEVNIDPVSGQVDIKVNVEPLSLMHMNVQVN